MSHIDFLDMFHIISHGVNRRQVLIAKPRLYFFQILHLLSIISNFNISNKNYDLPSKIIPVSVPSRAHEEREL